MELNQIKLTYSLEGTCNYSGQNQSLTAEILVISVLDEKSLNDKIERLKRIVHENLGDKEAFEHEIYLARRLTEKIGNAKKLLSQLESEYNEKRALMVGMGVISEEKFPSFPTNQKLLEASEVVQGQLEEF